MKGGAQVEAGGLGAVSVSRSCTVTSTPASRVHQSAYIVRRLKSIITSKYGRHKLANDGTQFGDGQPIVTPNVIRGELISEYGKMELDGHVENSEMFQQYLIVERDSNNPSRVNVLYPPDYVNGLRIFALLNQFRQQYAADAA